MKDVLVCKTCLITNVKMFHLDTLANAYSELTGLECDNVTTEYVCYECAALLLKYQQFRTKCLKANQVISEFIGKYCKITENVLTAIDRKLHNLESTINKFEIKENIFIELYNESKCDKRGNEGSEQSIKIEIDDVIVANEIKDEVELYDDKDQDVSDGNESLYLEDDISLDDDCSLKDYVRRKRKKTEDGIIKIKKKRGRPSKKLEHESDKERTKFSKLQNRSSKENRKNDNSCLDEYVSVVNLTPEAAKEEVLLRKESNNYKSCRFKCDLCYRGFEALKTYENHMKKHNKEIGEYECDYCHIRFPEQKYLCKHRISCHTKKFSCKLCPYSCFCHSQAKLHINLHKGKKYPCKECGQIFSMPNSLLMHKRFKHPTECVCAMCGSTFGNERGLRSHVMLIHKQETNEQKGPLCEECDVHFATETAWKRHLVLSSKHTVSNGCEVCGDTYESEDALKRHTRVHARKQMGRPRLKMPTACNLCEKWLVTRTEYNAHMRKDHPEVASKLEDFDKLQCVCEVCGKMFKKQSFLTYHQRVHTGERPYSCLECGKSYALQGALTAHRATHSSARAHKCHLCHKTFVFRSSLDKHVKAHLGIRPHKCKICEKAFANPCDVKIHTQYVHFKVPWPKRDRSKRNKSTSESAPAQFLYTTS